MAESGLKRKSDSVCDDFTPPPAKRTKGTSAEDDHTIQPKGESILRPARLNFTQFNLLHWPLQQRATPAVPTSTLHWPPLKQRATPAVPTSTLHYAPIQLPANPAVSPALNVYAELEKLETTLKYKFTNKLFLLQALRHPSAVSALDESNDNFEFLGDKQFGNKNVQHKC
jgi:hypothetical protein